MKRKALLLFPALLILSLSACSGTTSTELESTPAEDREYIGKVRVAENLFADFSDEELITEGKTICNRFDGGLQITQLVDEVFEDTQKLQETMVIMNASIQVYCEEHKPMFDEWVEKYSQTP